MNHELAERLANAIDERIDDRIRIHEGGVPVPGTLDYLFDLLKSIQTSVDVDKLCEAIDSLDTAAFMRVKDGGGSCGAEEQVKYAQELIREAFGTGAALAEPKQPTKTLISMKPGNWFWFLDPKTNEAVVFACMKIVGDIDAPGSCLYVDPEGALCRAAANTPVEPVDKSDEMDHSNDAVKYVKGVT